METSRGSQNFELRTGIGDISTSDEHIYKCQMRFALKQVSKEAAAGSETSRTSTSGPLHSLLHQPFCRGHLSGQAFYGIPESLVMTISLSLHAWHLFGVELF